MPDQEIEATLGPYRGQRLTMPEADAGAAIAANWAIDPFVPPADPPTVLTEAEREAAIAAATAWQTAQLEAAAGEQADPPEGGATAARTMSAETPRTYKTRGR